MIQEDPATCGAIVPQAMRRASVIETLCYAVEVMLCRNIASSKDLCTFLGVDAADLAEAHKLSGLKERRSQSEACYNCTP